MSVTATDAVSRPRPAPSPASVSRSADDAPRDLARIGWAIASLFVGFSGEQVWGASATIPGANITAVALIAIGITGIWHTLARKKPLPAWMQLLLLTALAVGFGYQAVTAWAASPAYGTDAAAFDQYAATLAMHGHNPYTTSMEPSLSMFHVPAVFHTYRLDGTAVNALSYPAGSFLPYMPLLAVGVTWQVANLVDVAFWFAGMLLLWRMLPRDLRWVAAIIGSAGMYFSFVVGGLTDALFIPFVLLAVYKWDRFADLDVTWWRRWAGPLGLGVAMSIKQTPWFLAPFLLLGLWFEARANGVKPAPVIAKYATAVFGVFTVVNAPWLLTNPTAWVKGCLVPFTDPTIPDGQGLVSLTVFHGLGGGNLTMFSVLAVAFFLFALAAFTLRYDRLKRAWVPLIGLMFFLPTRSFGSYLFMMVPAAIIAATTVRAVAANPLPQFSHRARPILAVALLPVLAAGYLALSSAAPLSITVVGTRSTGQLQTLDQVIVRVTNRTGQTLHPHFTINTNDHATTFWYVLGDTGVQQVTLAPHQSTQLTLQAPNTASMPSLSTPLLVEAYTKQPASVSVSDKYLVSSINTRIIPDATNLPVHLHTPTRITVQAENQYGSPIREAGIPITLNQTVYGQNGFMAGESSINGHPEGFSPVVVNTNHAGKAVFTVEGDQAQSAPVYYQAWVADRTAPHGYSNILTIRYIP